MGSTKYKCYVFKNGKKTVFLVNSIDLSNGILKAKAFAEFNETNQQFTRINPREIIVGGNYFLEEFLGESPKN